jgi:inorganic phosphate transporter, PiT family
MENFEHGLLLGSAVLAFYLAWNLGANDVANAMGTSVGSKAVTLGQALVIAAVLELSGALLFGDKVASTLAGQIANPAEFTAQTLLWGMVAVLLACGLWMNLATLKGLPVSSSHAIVGAIAGFAYLAVGPAGIDWPSLGRITLTWVLTPVGSGAIAAGLYQLLRLLVLPSDQPDAAANPASLEQIFARLQLLSACGVAFAHGSNDVGNAIAPLAVIASILQTGQAHMDSVAMPLWILLLGGLGIVGGLAVWGKYVIITVGSAIVELVPSQGFCCELATALVVLGASQLGLPVSTSHALVGSVVGIGLVQNWRALPVQTLGGIALAWGVTIPVAAGLSMALFAGFQRVIPAL